AQAAGEEGGGDQKCQGEVEEVRAATVPSSSGAYFQGCMGSRGDGNDYNRRRSQSGAMLEVNHEGKGADTSNVPVDITHVTVDATEATDTIDATDVKDVKDIRKRKEVCGHGGSSCSAEGMPQEEPSPCKESSFSGSMSEEEVHRKGENKGKIGAGRPSEG
ncbi:unnamed protein product, partial [Discosporangium mesarthrocarpum]